MVTGVTNVKGGRLGSCHPTSKGPSLGNDLHCIPTVLGYGSVEMEEAKMSSHGSYFVPPLPFPLLSFTV